jgi:hypothetical protein
MCQRFSIHVLSLIAIGFAITSTATGQETETYPAPELSDSYTNFIEENHAATQMAAHEELVKQLEQLLAKLHAAEGSGVRPIDDYLVNTKRELKTIDDWFAEAVRRNPDRVTQLLVERDAKIDNVWSAFRNNRRREYQGVRVTKDDYQHASRDPVDTPGGTRGKTERTCRVEAPSDEYTLVSARMAVDSRMGDTHVGDISYMPHGRGCTLYIYAKARSYGSTERSRVGVTLMGTFGLKGVVVNSRVASDERWLRDRT